MKPETFEKMGGPAFPVDHPDMAPAAGMTLWDYFASNGPATESEILEDVMSYFRDEKGALPTAQLDQGRFGSLVRALTQTEAFYAAHFADQMMFMRQQSINNAEAGASGADGYAKRVAHATEQYPKFVEFMKTVVHMEPELRAVNLGGVASLAELTLKNAGEMPA